MSKLYPPIISGVLPAFYGSILTVQFSISKMTNKNDISQIYLKVKTFYGNTFLFTKSNDHIYLEKGEVEFLFSDSELKYFNINQFYKIQIAFANDGIVGYYSDVGIIKYTAPALVEIKNLLSTQNFHTYEYQGVYSTKDLSEKVYSYKFNIYNESNTLIFSSGEKIHNIETDEVVVVSNGKDEFQQLKSVDNFTYNKDIDYINNYYIEYEVTTMHNLSIKSQKYQIVQGYMPDIDLKVKLEATLNAENAFIELTLMDQRESQDDLQSGNYKIVRAEDTDNYQEWIELFDFQLNGDLSKFKYKDFLIEQGKTYQYAIQQYNNNGVVSNKENNVTVQAQFEHIYLFDGQRQLKIKYNPKVTSFKNTILESKTDTIGSKYPFIFRNGNVQYKEFQISGLISCWSDEQFLFANEEMFKNFEYNNNLTNNNISTERDFKLEVLAWLNNGEAKLFKSSTEGNYIVRLLNVSLTPNDTLGRMLHSFNCSAFEIANYDYNGLITQKILNMDKIYYNKFESKQHELNNIETRWMSISPHPITSIVVQNFSHIAELFFNDKSYIILPNTVNVVQAEKLSQTVISISSKDSGTVIKNGTVIINTECKDIESDFDKIVNVTNTIKTTYDESDEIIYIKQLYCTLKDNYDENQTSLYIDGEQIDLYMLGAFTINSPIKIKSLKFEESIDIRYIEYLCLQKETNL